jgi:hypothetical protein
VDDLVPHIDRRTEPLERELDDLDRAIHAGAETPGRSNQDVKWRAVFGHRGGDVSARLQQ